VISKVRRPDVGAPAASVWDKQQARRFAACFPRLYAFVLAMTEDEVRSRETATNAFAETIALRASEQEFLIELFRQARKLSAPHVRTYANAAPRLTLPEREAISLVFDAQLSSEQIALVLGISRGGVADALLEGLRKLQATASHESRYAAQR
jgi:DNA-directed RNA polymerase specialized sigma24 family protein